jgi:hypothetical protein
VYDSAIAVVEEPHAIESGEEVMPPLNVLADGRWNPTFELFVPF